MAIAMRGLRLKPTYESLIGVAASDKLFNVKFPNRTAKFLREGFVLSQLDGEGMRQMEKQQEMASKEAYKEHLMKQAASSNSDNISHYSFRTANEGDLRQQRINDMLERGRQEINNTEFHDIIDTAEAGINTDTEPNPLYNHIHVEDHISQIQALQQEAYNREVAQEAVYRNNLQLVQQDARRDLYELEGSVLQQQGLIQYLTARMHTQQAITGQSQPASSSSNLAITDQQRLQAITDQQRLQAITDQPRLQAITDQPRLQAITDQPESRHEPRGSGGRPSNTKAKTTSGPKPKAADTDQSSSSSDDRSYLFGKSITGLLMIQGKTKASWGKAKKTEMQTLLKDFNIPFDPNEKNLQLYNKIVSIFEQNGG